jgi:hypothetical protein
MAIHKDLTGAAALHQIFEHSESDPGSGLGAYKGWIKPSTGEVKIRNAANSAWITIIDAVHPADTSDAHDASAISVLDTAGNFTGTDVETVLDELADTIVSGGTPDASETVKGKAEIATQTETNTGTDDTRFVTPAKFAGRTATETRAGVIEIATQGETDAGSDDARAVTPAKLANYSGLGGGGSADLEGLSDVDLTSPALDQGLFHDGTQFVNKLFNGRHSTPVTVSTSGSVAADTYAEIADTSGGSITRTLPTAAGRAGKVYSIKKKTTDGNTCTVATTGSETIDLDDDVLLDNAFEGLTCISDGANWHTISRPYQGVQTIAAEVNYDNTTSGLSADNLQEAVDEIVAEGVGGGSAALSGYSVTNETTDKTYDANATTVDELADVLATVINDLTAGGGGGGGGGFTPDWVDQSGANSLFSNYGDGDPNRAHDLLQLAATQNLAQSGLTPQTTATGVGQGRKFRLPKALSSIGHIYMFAVGTTSALSFAIYRDSDGVRMWNDVTPSISVGMNDITTGLPINLAADTDYWWCVSTTNVASSTRVFDVMPIANVAIYGAGVAPFGGKSIGSPEVVQFTLTSGVWPTTMPTKVAVSGARPGPPFAWFLGTAS